MTYTTKATRWIDDALKFDGDECLTWPYSKEPDGYTRFRSGTKRFYVHRVICEKAHGSAPTSKHQVAHSCGNGHLACVNPRHLRWATTAENQAEKVAHGRSSRGVKNANAKYDEQTVEAIRGLRKCGLVQREIAEIVGATRGTVRDVLTGKSWAWLGGVTS